MTLDLAIYLAITVPGSIILLAAVIKDKRKY